LELLLRLLKGKSLIAFEQFLEIDIRVGKIISAEKFPEARNPAYIIRIDFGEDLGVKKSSAQITENYSLEELKGKLIMAVVNFPIKQIGSIRSEVLVLGVADSDGNIVLVSPEKNVQLGVRLH
jgi:tRNA-binding protein